MGSVVVAPSAETASAPNERLSPPGSPMRRALVATLAGLLAFLLIQSLLALVNAHVIRDAIDRGWLDPSPSERPTLSLVGSALLGGAIAYLVVSLAGSAIASRGHRYLFAMPAVALLFVSVLPWPHQPQPFGPEWSILCFAPVRCSWPWFAHPWLGASVDLALVLLPGAVLARSVPARRWPEQADAPAIAAILAAAATAGTAWWALAAIEAYVDPATLATVTVFGLLLGAGRPWWPWLHVLYTAFAAGSLWLLIEFEAWSDPTFSTIDALPYELRHLWPILAVCLLASAWRPFAAVLRRLRDRPSVLAVAINVLNAVDAIMTQAALRTGDAYESNPLVRLIGMPAKIALVGLLTWLLFRRKPSALIWPFAALVWVTAYHIAGWLVTP